MNHTKKYKKGGCGNCGLIGGKRKSMKKNCDCGLKKKSRGGGCGCKFNGGGKRTQKRKKCIYKKGGSFAPSYASYASTEPYSFLSGLNSSYPLGLHMKPLV